MSNRFTPHKVNELDNFIMAWYPSDTTMCDQLLEFWNDPEYQKYKSNGLYNVSNKLVVNKEVKDSKDLSLHYAPEYFKQEFYGWLHQFLELYKEKYRFTDDVLQKWGIVTHGQIQHYKPNGGFKEWHCERSGMNNNKRVLTYMTYLNDVDDRGETEFYYQKVKIKPKKGLTVIWPTDFTHVHRGIPSPSQEKYIITGWYEFL